MRYNANENIDNTLTVCNKTTIVSCPYVDVIIRQQWLPGTYKTRNCEGAKSMTYNVPNKMRKYFAADTKSPLVTDCTLYTTSVFDGCLDPDINFHIFILHFIR